MAIEISKPFESYVAEEKLPPTGDAHKFALRVPYEIEGTNRTSQWRMEWRYSCTQETVDQNNGVDGLTPRQERARAQLRATIERELKAAGERLYEVPGRALLIRGPAKER